MHVALTIAALVLHPIASATPGPFTIVFAPNPPGLRFTPDGERVIGAVASALGADPDAAVIVESRGWGGFEGYSVAQCRWARRARQALIARGIAPERIALRAPTHMAWQRAPRDTLRQPARPQLDFRLGSATEAANVRAMPDSCLSRLRP